MQLPMKGGVRTTSETLVCQAQIHDDFDRPHSVREVSRQLQLLDGWRHACPLHSVRGRQVHDGGRFAGIHDLSH